MSYGVDSTKPLSFWLKEIWDRGRKGHALARTAAGLSALSPLMALANPTGGQVVAGSAHISTPSANSTLIRETSQNAVINWQQFSVGSNQFVQFLQPDSSAIVLNRVIGGNASTILGDITANGQVFLINPNGILFGRGATLDVSGLVASTQNIGNADFMAGRYDFLKGSGAPNASIINQGTITSTRNGYVVLAGDYVENDGIIQAQSGRVLLAAGGATTLTLDRAEGLISYSIDGATLARLAGVRNTGEISADGGTVIMSADVANALTATAVNNSGFVAAHSIKSRDGVIILAAVGGDIDNSGTLDASASQAGVAGGTVVLRGDAATVLAPSSKIDAGGAGAKGGYIELSGHRLHVGGLTQTGAGGSLLIDPAKIHIVSGGASGLGTGNTNSFGTAFLAGKLNSNHNVTLVASQSIAHLGTTAIAINAPTGTGNLALKIGTVAVGAGGSLSGAGCVLHGLCQPGTGTTFTPVAGGTINIKGVTINIGGKFLASAQQGHVSAGSITAKSVQVFGDDIVLGNVKAASTVQITALHIGLGAGGNVNAGNISAGGGVQIQAQDSNGSGASVHAGNIKGQYVSINANAKRRADVSVGSLTATGTGTAAKFVSIFAHANGGANSSGGNIRVGGNIAAPGSVNLNAFGGLDSGGNIGVTGAINAGGIVTLLAVNDGSFGGSVSVGPVKGQFVNISARDTLVTNSNGAHITVNGNITATGAATSISPSNGVTLHAGSSGAQGGNPNITVHGDITAVNAAVNVINYGSHGGRAITLGSLSINGGAWSHGKVTATHMNIGLDGVGGNATLNTGTLDATAGRISVNNFAPSGSIDIHGSLAATGTARVFQSGIGHMSIDGAVHVGGFFAQFSNDGGGIDINGSVSVAGQFNAAAFGQNGADITVNGNISAGAVRLTANAGSRSGGNVTVNGNVNATAGAVTIRTTGGVEVGGNLQVGNISAAGSVSINASHQGILGGPTVQTGTITGEYVFIGLAGKGAHLKTGAITAFGASTGTNCHCEGGPHGIPGFVDIRLTRPGSNSAASLSIGGPIRSQNGLVSISASTGALKVTGAISAAKNVFITGNTISIAGVTAGGGVSILGNTHNRAAHITATGLVKGQRVFVDVNNHPGTASTAAAFGGSINLAGGASATGIPSASLSIGKTGIDIQAYTKSLVRMNIATGALTAAGGNVTVKQGGASGSISVNGNVTASTGNVVITDHGRGNITVTGNIAAARLAEVETKNSSGSGANITINGSVTGGSIVITGSASTGANIKVTGGLTAKTGNVFVAANSSSGGRRSGGNISVAGPVNASHGSVSFFAAGGGRSGGNITVGNVTAARGIDMFADYFGTVEAGATKITLQTGNLVGEYESLAAHGPAATIKTGSITANGTTSVGGGSHHDFIKIRLQPTKFSSSGRISIAGPVLSSHGSVSFSAGRGSINAGAVSGMTGISMVAGGITVGALTATSGDLNITGLSDASRSDVIKVTGAISAEHVLIKEVFGSAARFGGSIDLQGNATATGNSTSPGFITIAARKPSGSPAVRMQIVTSGLTANGPITLAQQGAGGGILATGTISGSNVSIHANGSGGISAAKIVSATNVKLIGSGSHAGSINVNGPITAGNNITLSDAGLSAGINVAGAIKATGGSVDVRILGSGGISVHSVTAHTALILSGSGNVAGNITVNGNLTAATGPLYVTDSGVAAGISINGNVAANAAFVFFTGNGSGGITVNGNVNGHSGVSIRTLGSHAKAVTVNGSISASGEGVTLSARGTGGNNVTVNGNITVGSHAEAGMPVRISASAGTHSGGNINVAGTITTNIGAVLLTAHGGGVSGGRISVGSIGAQNNVSISATYVGTSPGFTVKTGKITGEYVNIVANGKAPGVTIGGATATGASSNESGVHDYVHVTLLPTGTTSGSLNLTGPVKSVHGNVVLNAAHGTITDASAAAGKITAGNSITVNGGQIQLGSLSAGRMINVTASGAGRADTITVDGNIKAPGVRLQAFTTGGSGGDVTVNGNITSLTAPSPSFFSGGVQVTANAGSSHSGGNINISGNVTAASRGVFLNAHGGGANGGNINVGNISASGSGVSINARYNGASTGFHVKTGTITAGFIQVNMDGLDPLFSGAGLTGTGLGCECSADVSVRLSNASFAAAPGGSIHLTGAVTAANAGVSLNAGFGVVNMGGNSISAAGTFGRVRLKGDQLHLGSVKGTGDVSISAFGKSGNAASITNTSTDTITGTRVDINLDNSGSANGAKLAIGAVTATGTALSSSAGHISIKDTGFSTQHVTVTTGRLTATQGITVQITDASGSMTLGKLTAPSVKVSLAAGNLVTAKVVANAGGASLSAATGSLTVAGGGSMDLAHDTLKAGKAVKLQATGNLTLTSDTITGSLLSASAGSNLKDSVSGTLNLNGGTLKAGKALTLVAGSDVTLGGAKLSGSAVNITARSITNSGSAGTITAGGGTLAATGNISLNGETLHLSGAGETLTGSSVTISSAIVTGTGNLTAHAVSEMGANSLSFTGRALQLTGSSVRVAGAKVTATKGVTFKGGFISMNNLHVAGSAVNISASSGSLNNGGSGSITAGAGGVSIKSGRNLVLTGEAISITGGGALFSAGGTLNMVGQSINAAKAVTLKAGAGNLNLSGMHLKGSAVNISAAAGNVSNGTGAASISGGAGGVGIKAHGNIGLANETLTVAGGTAALSAGGSVNLTSATVTGNMNAHAGTALNAASLTFSGGGLQVTAGGNIGLVSATLTAVGSIVLSGANVDLDAATVSATKAVDANAGGNVTLRVASLAGAAVAISAAGGNVTNSGSAGSITAGAGGMNIKARQNVGLGDEILHVNGGGAKLSAGGSLDLTNATLTAGKGVSLTAGKHILIGKTAITAGSAFSATANGSISDGGSAGAITARSAVLKAKSGKIDLSGETLHVGSGKATLSAGGGIVLTGADIIAGNLSGVTAGSIDLSGVTAKVGGTLQLVADKDIILSGVHITTGTFLAAASGTIHNGGGPGTITADAISVASKKDINLASTAITLGSGALPSFAGDALLLTELAGFGIGPVNGTLNGAFLADGSLTLGGLTITGHYLALQGTSIAILGKVTAPTSGLLVQVMPFDPTAAIGVEGKSASTQTFNISNQDFFALFPGDTIAIGDDVESGAVFIGANGPFTLADKTNLFFDTTGPVTGLDLITSTGLVTTLEVFVAATGGDVVTVGEIDPNAGSTTSTGLGDETDKKHLGGAGLGGGTGPQGGTISNDDSGTGVCH